MFVRPSLLAPPALALAAILTAAAGLAATPLSPLARFQDRNRVLVALASSPDDPLVARQKEIVRAMHAGAQERDLVFVDGSQRTPDAEALRRQFGFGGGFKAVLIGKDGGEKLAATHPLGPEDLFPLIDAMPMRREEMRRRK